MITGVWSGKCDRNRLCAQQRPVVLQMMRHIRRVTVKVTFPVTKEGPQLDPSQARSKGHPQSKGQLDFLTPVRMRVAKLETFSEL
ncbi:hypothetical protein chiPu_0021317 [Chiloscyllium punctatum]|uniref:Uncharacterized protein n=1 Tax=Chiloscyllium punctatum TaxID=137246 RepID=A0A401RQ19_CHIPU|nr:hypothetical protein [Chiloscyllium punctatum]